MKSILFFPKFCVFKFNFLDSVLMVNGLIWLIVQPYFLLQRNHRAYIMHGPWSKIDCKFWPDIFAHVNSKDSLKLGIIIKLRAAGAQVTFKSELPSAYDGERLTGCSAKKGNGSLFWCDGSCRVRSINVFFKPLLQWHLAVCETWVTHLIIL